jgi:hypothetical protein
MCARLIGMAAVLDRAEIVGDRITRSENRNPAASSRSCPGVRMMIAKDLPCSRTSSGSSAAARSLVRSLHRVRPG